MKKLLLVLWLLAPALQGYAQKEQEVIKKTRTLVAEKKYESAYNVLLAFDPRNKNPDILLLKEDIALNFYATSLMHRMFSFVDLRPGEDLVKYRGKENINTMHELPVNDLIDTLLKTHPENYRLYKGLGEYYFEVFSSYGGNWLVKGEELLNRIESNYTIAVDHNLGDYKAWYALGFANVAQGRYPVGIPFLLKAKALDSTVADVNYNLAYAYLYTGEQDSALKYGKSALKMGRDVVLKADAARMIGVIYGEKNDYKSAIQYVDISNRIDPGNYNTLKTLLALYLASGNDNDKVKPATEKLYNAAPDKPATYNDLTELFTLNDRKKDLIEFYKSKIQTVKNNQVQLGNLYFYLGRLYIDTDKNQARENLVKARDILSKVYPKDHQVFKEIEDALSTLN